MDNFFTVKLELFQRLVSDCEYFQFDRVTLVAVLLGTFRSCVLDVTSFAINLGQRRDATFFLCGEMCKYINRLCFRIYQPDTVPLESAWFLLMDFRISQGKPMSDEDFLVRLKIASKVTSASNLKAAGFISTRNLARQRSTRLPKPQNQTL